MSYHYRGRYTHDHAEFLRWQQADSQSQLQQRNTALQNDLSATRQRLQRSAAAVDGNRNNIRRLSAETTRLAQQERRLDATLNTLQSDHQRFARRTQTRQRELAQDIAANAQGIAANARGVATNARGVATNARGVAANTRRVQQLQSDVNAGFRRVDRQIGRLDNRIDHVDARVDALRAETRGEFARVRQELQRSHEILDDRIDAVHHEFTEDRRQRIAKNRGLAAEAADLAGLVAEELGRVEQVDPLELSSEREAVRQQLRMVEHTLAGNAPEQAANAARSAMAGLNTVLTERERRLGELEGVRDHLRDVQTDVETMTRNPEFVAVFPDEAARAQEMVRALTRTGDSWVRRCSWVAYRASRDEVLDVAEAVRSTVVAMTGHVKPLLNRLEEREKRLSAAAQRVLEAQGAPDAWDTLFSRRIDQPDGSVVEDPKSDRILRAQFGDARVDWYEGLDGSWRIDAYGFTSASECDRRSEQVLELLTADLAVEEGGFNSSNPQCGQPSSGRRVWDHDSETLEQLASRIKTEL
jgi:hypothetical protein